MKARPNDYDYDSTEAAVEYSPEPVNIHLFDVTAVIGSVYSGGTEDPRLVAFRMIAEHGADSTFNFPDKDGNIVSVTVETTKPA